MFRFFVQVLLVVSLFFNTSLVFCAKEKSDVEKMEEQRKMVEEKKKDLNGTSWPIDIKSSSGKGALSGSDQLVFQDGKFTSKKMSKKGYPSTNYTITPSENGPSVWETMQTSAGDGVSFWRGEWTKDSMTGVINRQVKDSTEDYYFASSGKEKISPTSENEEEEIELAQTSAESKTLSSTTEKVSDSKLI